VGREGLVRADLRDNVQNVRAVLAQLTVLAREDLILRRIRLSVLPVAVAPLVRGERVKDILDGEDLHRGKRRRVGSCVDGGCDRVKVCKLERV